MGVISTILLSAGVLRHYWDIYTHRTVRGISFIFVGIDAAGDVFSFVSVCKSPLTSLSYLQLTSNESSNPNSISSEWSSTQPNSFSGAASSHAVVTSTCDLGSGRRYAQGERGVKEVRRRRRKGMGMELVPQMMFSCIRFRLRLLYLGRRALWLGRGHRLG